MPLWGEVDDAGSDPGLSGKQDHPVLPELRRAEPVEESRRMSKDARRRLKALGIVPSRMIVAAACLRKPNGKPPSIYHVRPVTLHRPGAKKCLDRSRSGTRGVTSAVAKGLMKQEEPLAVWCGTCW